MNQTIYFNILGNQIFIQHLHDEYAMVILTIDDYNSCVYRFVCVRDQFEEHPDNLSLLGWPTKLPDIYPLGNL